MEELLQLHAIIPDDVPDTAHSEVDGGFDDVFDLLSDRFPMPNKDNPSYDHLGTAISSSLFERRPDNMELVTEIQSQLEAWYPDASVFRSSYEQTFGEVRSAADPNTHIVLLVTNRGVDKPSVRWAIQKETVEAPPLVLGDDIVHANAAGIFAIDSASGATRWENTSVQGLQVPVGTDDQIIVNSGRQLTALDRATGEIQWQTEFDVGNDAIIDSRVTLGDEKAYVGLRSGAVIAVSLDTGDSTVLGDCDDSVVRLQRIESGLLAITMAGAGYLIGSDGIEPWPANHDPSLNIKHADNGSLYVSTGSSLLAISETDGSTEWELDISTVVSIAQHEDILIATTRDRVVGIDTRTGAQTWEQSLTDNFGSVSGPVVADGVAGCISSRRTFGEELYPCKKNTFHFFDPADGTELQQFDLGVGDCKAPATVGDAVVVSVGGELICLDTLPTPA